MKKKFLAVIMATFVAAALVPSLAFAAVSPGNQQTKTYSGESASATLSGSSKSIDLLTVANTGTNVWAATFTDGTTTDFGTLVLNFTVGTQYDGQTATVAIAHSDGTTETQTATVSNGVVSVTVTSLSTFTITFSGATSTGTATSPKTGMDMTGIAVMGGIAIVAAGVFFLARKRVQQ